MKSVFPRRRTGASLLISIAIHAGVIALLVHIVFKYPLGQLMGIPKEQMRPERLQYIALPPRAIEASSSKPTRAKSASSAPAALQAPTTVPNEIPVPPTDSAATQAAGATGDGNGSGAGGVATGIVPRLPDPRIALEAGPLLRAPHTVAYDVDSIISVAIGVYVDSMAIAAGQRQPGDWTVKGKDGKVWGWDKNGIRLGKFTIPNALLALLPLNVAGGGSPIEARDRAYIRRDVLENTQRAISEDEFRAAVKRIRERKDREKRQKIVAQAKGSASP